MSLRRLFAPHAVYGHRFIPDLKARVPCDDGHYLLRTNSCGFRSNCDFEPKKLPSHFRILVFGDSFTAGDSVRNEDRYTDLLENSLPATEVLNFGVSGTGTDQQYLIFREEAAAFEYDLLVISVLVENIRRIAARYRPYQDETGATVYFAKPYFELGPAGDLALRGTPVAPEPLRADELPPDELTHVDQGGRFAALRSVANALGARDLLQKVTGYQPVPDYDHPDDPAWCLMRAILERWIAEARAPVILFPLPLYQHVEETSSPIGYQARFAELSDPPRVRVHDPLPDLMRYDLPTRRSFRFEHDIHPTPLAHRALAASLAEAVRPLLANA
jgi:lysophospholipase L1-like esterase